MKRQFSNFCRTQLFNSVSFIAKCIKTQLHNPIFFLLVAALPSNYAHAQQGYPSTKAERLPRPDVPVRAKAIDESTIQYVDITYTGGPISDSFINLVFEYGARRNVTNDKRTELSEFVKNICEISTENSYQLFSLALDEIGLIEKAPDGDYVLASRGEFSVPPCLPSLTLIPTIRVVLPDDTIDAYYQADQACEGCVKMDWTDGNSSIIREFELFSSYLEAYLKENKIGLIEETNDYLNGLDILEENSVKERIESFSEDLIDHSGDNSELAIMAVDFAIPLIAAGLPFEEVILESMVEVTRLNPSAAAHIEIGLRLALTQYGKDKSALSKNLWKLAGINQALEEYIPEKFDGSQLKYAETTFVLPKDLRVRPSTVTLNRGDLVFSLKAESSSVRIPIDLLTVAIKRNTLPNDLTRISNVKIRNAVLISRSFINSELEANPPIPQTDVTPTLSEDNAVLFTNVSSGSCKSETSFTDDEDLLVDLGTAAFRSRLAMIVAGQEPKSVEVAIADSGYSKLTNVNNSPFRYSVDQIFNTKEDSPLRDYDNTFRNHGTAVTGVAIGGPMSWPLTNSLGLTVNVKPIRIYVKEPGSDEGKIVPWVSRIQRPLDNPLQIVNLSIGEKKSALGLNGAIQSALSDYFDDRGGPLYIIAAGNNGANSGVAGGVDVLQLGLYPQILGAENAMNVLVVGATEGRTRANFSNFSEEAVSIMAPGCGVTSWIAGETSLQYEESNFTGTSFSAPLVTYVASLVFALSPSDFRSARRVKARILASADLVPDLTQDSTDGRMLNAVKAVSLYHDVVEERSTVDGVEQSNLVFGSFQDEDVKLGRFCLGAFVENGELLKISKSPYENTIEQIIYYVWDDATGLTSGYCTPRQSVNFRREGEKSGFGLSLANVNDIVFRWRTE